MNKILLTRAGWIATADSNFEEAEPYKIVQKTADSILIEDGIITWVGNLAEYSGDQDIPRIDLNGLGVTPGLIDFHAHPVFARTREEEFELRTQGYSYEEIAASGGGILNSIKHVREASEEDLYNNSLPYLQNALCHGTTTMEAKSGYGLNPDTEYKMLRVIRKLGQDQPVTLLPTFLGAHEFPPEFRNDHEGYIKLLTETMIPYVAREKLAHACDIFCEKGVFSVEEAQQVLQSAREHGLKIKVHADQLTSSGGAKLAANLGGVSADHLEYIDEEGMEALLANGTVAGLLPVATHFLREKHDPPVRKMIQRGIICALATDFNPGSAMCENMQLAMHLAVIRFRITSREALWMSTLGSAQALGLTDRGWIGPGAKADLVAWKAKSPEMLCYHFGINQAAKVFVDGNIVAENGSVT